jgi:cytidylate kinase
VTIVTGNAAPTDRNAVTVLAGQSVVDRLRVGNDVIDHQVLRVAGRGQAAQEERDVDRLGRRAVLDRVREGSGRVLNATIQQEEQEVAVSDRRMTIAIDGPAAAGKSTVGEIVARKIDGVYFDTGLLYRALTLLAIEASIAPTDAHHLAELAASMDIRIGKPSIDDGRQADVLLNGRDVTHALRTPSIDRNVSAVSAHANVRAALLEQQRRIGRSGRVVMVGRDIGTVVLPDAELKVFLDASSEERARRRSLQLDEMGRPLPYDEILTDMVRRDRIDSERDVAPLRPADDAIVIDSDRLSIEEVAAIIVDHAQQRLGTDCR